MFTMPTTRRETARVDAMIDAIYASAHPSLSQPDDHPTAPLPRIIVAGTATRDVDAIVDRLPFAALALVLVGLVVTFAVVIATLLTPPTHASVVPDGSLPGDTAEQVLDRGTYGDPA